MDYYKEYAEYAIEIDDACSCVNSNKCSNLNSEIETMTTAVDGLDLSSIWPDGVGGTFASVIETTKGCLNDISSSISSLFTESEGIYVKLQQQLLFLKNANIKYMNMRDNEKPSSDDFKVSAKYENGVIVKESYFRQSDYNRAIADWKGKVQALEDECITLKNEIEKNKTRLSEINSTTVMSSAGFTTLIMKYGENTLNVSTDYILELAEANGISFLTYSNWGENFYVLADITGGNAQVSNECLGWSNAYAFSMLNIITERMQNENPNFNVEKLDSDRPYMYSSKDKEEILKIMASEITNGRPVVIEVEGTTKKDDNGNPIIEYEDVPAIVDGNETTINVQRYNRHYVTVYGIREGADLDNLQESDFLYLDPAEGEIKQLGTSNGGSRQRNLINAQAAYTHESNQFYCVNVFSNTDYSSSDDLPNTEQISHRMTQDTSSTPVVNYSNETKTYDV